MSGLVWSVWFKSKDAFIDDDFSREVYRIQLIATSAAMATKKASKKIVREPHKLKRPEIRRVELVAEL